MTFDAFRFRAPVIFVEPLVDPSDLCEAGMRVLVFFFHFCHVCVHISSELRNCTVSCICGAST